MSVKGKPVIPSSYQALPNQVWYWRDFKSDTLHGPSTFHTADMSARRLSQRNVSKVTEMVVLTDSGTLEVVATYVLGKKRYIGNRARQANINNLPPVG